jgi:hypothetical protein
VITESRNYSRLFVLEFYFELRNLLLAERIPFSALWPELGKPRHQFYRVCCFNKTNQFITDCFNGGIKFGEIGDGASGRRFLKREFRNSEA